MLNSELKIIESNGHTYYLKDGKKLISTSAITKLFGSKYLEIPEFILSKAKKVRYLEVPHLGRLKTNKKVFEL